MVYRERYCERESLSYGFFIHFKKETISDHISIFSGGEGNKLDKGQRSGNILEILWGREASPDYLVNSLR